MKKLEKSVPVIRFKGFSEAWEQRKVSDYAINTYGGGTPKTNVPEYWSGEIPWIQSSDLLISNLFNVIPKKYITELAVKSSATKFIPANSIAIVSRVGVGKLVFMPFEYTTSQDFLSLSNLQVDSNFGVYSIYMMLQKELKNIQGTSIKGITKTDLLEKNINKPSSREEQQKIGAFFKQLDNTITLHQRKLDALKLMKKGFLQQMFPKIEADIPKIRFADFDGKWEQRKLGEIFNERSERSADGELISVTINSGVIKASKLEKKDNSSFDKSNYKVVKKGDIAYNSMRMWQGASGYSTYDGILSPAYTVIYPRKDIDTIFIAYMFKKIDMIQTFQRNSQGLTSDTWNLKFPSLSTIKIKIPANDEQIKITNLFQKLEYTSILHQNQIEMLKKVKKAYLQTMFI
ncbi:type I restriction endonuclease [Listeria monocytogenes]|uniref:restriction endonuclease subunit S n=3 Tax=Listeria monocytogenes TaxID=1639 RepID=UPI000BDEBB3F|nr:restriction endonuclease subunit S [Listeria monocytogenes]PCW74559.1 type I restriction endonuclease [Listeria monocytogenes]PCX95307.1 type I restriction endonuclease [Listeria monocytogenes]PCX97088.1 type I restriction endonuclease [Listeria monocytogenes]QKI94647.1 restriction endonuclease subunit S [Listeria monocytogenes]HCW3272600.1 restriction endonuclease subunit S [Listeria monocytogenes]